ncbi:hypothetical protein B0H34DRAFT_713578 [Crassisporium funariophilum]|nr:hypothetical protein B0H34DRAFT_713578 [Crassisporium funariophilum]
MVIPSSASSAQPIDAIQRKIEELTGFETHLGLAMDQRAIVRDHIPIQILISRGQRSHFDYAVLRSKQVS